MVSSLFDSLTIGLIITILAMSLTFFVMGLLVFIITRITPPEKPAEILEPKLVTKPRKFDLTIIIATAVGLFLEEEQEEYNATVRPIPIRSASQWEITGRHESLSGPDKF